MSVKGVDTASDPQGVEESYFEKKESFYDYVDSIVNDDDLIDEYFAVNSTPAREFVEVCAWLNRQFKNGYSSVQEFSFSADFHYVLNDIKETDKRQGKHQASLCVDYLIRFAEFIRVRNGFEEAIELHKEALRIEDSVFDRKRPIYSFSLYRLALSLCKMGKLEESEKVFADALEEAKKCFGENTSETASWMNNFAVCLRSKGRLEKALSFMLRSLQIDRNTLTMAIEEKEIEMSKGRVTNAVVDKVRLDEAIDSAKSNLALDLHNVALLFVEVGEVEKGSKAELEALGIDFKRSEEGKQLILPKMDTIVEIFKRLRQFKPAEALLRQELQRRRAMHSDDPQVIAAVLQLLAKVCGWQDNLEEAETLMKESLSLHQECDFEDVVEELPDELVFLGDVCTKLGKVKEALQFLQEALEILKETRDPQLKLIAKIHHDIGNLHRRLGEQDLALASLMQSAEMRKRVLGPIHPALGDTMNAIAGVHADMGKMQDAAEYYSFVLKIFRKVYGNESEQVASALNNLAMSLSDLGDYTQALQFEEECMNIRERIHGEQSGVVGSTLNNKACILRAMGRLEEAELDYILAISIGELTMGRDHPEVSLRKNNLGEVYISMNRYKEAEPLLRESIKQSSEKLGPDHPRVGIALNNLALLLGDIGKYEEASKLQRQLLKIDEQEYGKQNIFVARDLHNLGKYLRQMGQLQEAETVIRKALSMREQVLPPKHQHIGTSMNNLALCLRAKGETEKALEIGQKACEILEVSLGKSHKWTIAAKEHWHVD